MLPDQLRLSATLGGEPLAGAWFIINLPMPAKNDHRLLCGPASKDGWCTVTREDLLRKAAANSNFFISDYSSLQPDWFGTMDVFALPLAGIKMVMWAYEMFSTPNNYPSGFAELMETYRVTLSRSDSAPAIGDVEIFGGSQIHVRKAEFPDEWERPDP